MEILGVGPLEFGLILVLMFVLLGPGGMVRVGQQIGSFLRGIVRSDTWRAVVSSSKEIRQAQEKFMKESGIQDGLAELRDSSKVLHNFDPDPFGGRIIHDATSHIDESNDADESPTTSPQTKPSSPQDD